MYGSGLKKLAGEHHLTLGKGVVYGTLEGMGVSLWDGMGVKTLCVYIGKREAEWPDFERILDVPARKYRILNFLLDDERGALTIIFHDNPGTMKCIRAFIRAEMPKFKQMGFPGSSRCDHCGQPIPEGEACFSIDKASNSPIPLHAACMGEAEQKAAELVEIEKNEPHRVVLPVVGAFAGAIIGAIPWMALYTFGYYWSLAGMLIGMGAGYGYRVLGGRVGRLRTTVVILAVILAVAVAQAVGLVGAMAVSIQNGSMAEAAGLAKDQITMAHLLPIIVYNLSVPELRAEIMPGILKDLALGYLFAAFGLFWLMSNRLRASGRVATMTPPRLR